MRTNTKTILLLAFVAQTLLVVAGCSADRRPNEVAVRPDDPLQKYWNEIVAKRFEEADSQGSTAVESAIELSEKYADLSEEAAALRQQNQDLMAKNQQLKEQTAALDVQIRQAQKELAEANDLLIEMRIELNNWKSNILGFRDEMRDAETAQLEALLKILKVLGGQVPTEMAQAANVGSAVASLNKPDQP
jgi:outer membrane murein-binding lipoprotein Lpp